MKIIKKTQEWSDASDSNQINFQAYEVKIGIESDGKFDLDKISSRLNDIFPNGYQIIEKKEIEYQYVIVQKGSEEYGLHIDDEEVFSNTTEESLINFLEAHLRITIAEFAVGKVFMHAGVVGWEEKAIVIPGKSFAGKTTLVAELVKRGAVYYSDEYAVIGEGGLVYPYPKKLSIRGIIDDFRQVDFAVEELNGIRGVKPLPVGTVLIAEYKKGSRTNLEVLSRGRGLMEIMGHSYAFRQNPGRVMSVLREMVNHAIIFKVVRGEVVEFLDFFLEHMENNKINP